MTRVMLTEDQVNVAVKEFLKGRGWVNLEIRKGRQPGIDVLGDHPVGTRWVQVESKGGTSGQPGSAKFGKPYERNDVLNNVSCAVFTTIALQERSAENVVLIALPDDEVNLEMISMVQATLRTLNVGVLAVSTSGVRVHFGEVDPDPAPAGLKSTGA
jgi:hypothetical protein